MKGVACVLLLSAMLALQAPAVPIAIPLHRSAIVRMIDLDEPGLPRHRRRRNHYRGW